MMQATPDLPSRASFASVVTAPPCRFCGAPLERTFVDLGLSPLCQRHVEPDGLDQSEELHPLHVRVCGECFLVQLKEYVSPARIFDDYAYFSSYSDTWLAHAKAYSERMVERLRLGPESLVVELASNDGYLLQYFQQRGVPVLGIEPAANVAAVALAKGIPTISEFFGRRLGARLAAEHRKADLIVGNNVLAHVPDINDFVAGVRELLAPDGTVTMEFPHLLNLIEQTQFDTIYHEHFSYLGFCTVRRIFAAHGLTVIDVERLPTHGGSLRVHAQHSDAPGLFVGDRVRALTELEIEAGLTDWPGYRGFGPKVEAIKRKILAFLVEAKEQGKSIVGYGAPGKSATLLNYCGIRTDFLDYTVDRNPKKQGCFTPGTRIPIVAPERIRETRPDYVFILPWNLADEIMQQNDYIRAWGGQFVIPIPTPRVVR
jgi:SAM-dependent methyltransferase